MSKPFFTYRPRPSQPAKLAKLAMDSMEFTDSLNHTIGCAGDLPLEQIQAMILHLGRVHQELGAQLTTLKTIATLKTQTNQSNQSNPKSRPCGSH